MSRGIIDVKIKVMVVIQESPRIYEDFHKGVRIQKRIVGRKNFTYRLVLDYLEPYLVRQKRVLDVGCGVGTLSFYLANKGNDVTGVDISLNAVKVCRINAKKLGLKRGIRFKVGDFLKTKIKGFFDLTLCIEVLEHLVNDKLAVKKIFNSLINGGVAIITVPSQNAPLFRLGLTKRKDEKSGHLRRYTKKEMKKLLKDAGLKIVQTRETEGIFRNFLFYNRLGILPLKLANRFCVISDIFTFIDKITLRLSSESQIIIVAQRPGRKI